MRPTRSPRSRARCATCTSPSSTMHPRAAAGADLARQEPDGDARPRRPAPPRDAPLPGAPAPREHGRLRRPADRNGAAADGGRRGAHAVPRPLPLPARRRVPGHERPAVRDRPQDRRLAPKPLRRRRRRPVDLRLARRGRAQDPSKFERDFPGAVGDPAGDQLPLDAADPRRREQGHPQQPGAARKDAAQRARSRLATSSDHRGRGRGDRGARRRRRHS